MEGRGYEPFEAVRCVTPNFLAYLSVQEALRALFSVLVDIIVPSVARAFPAHYSILKKA